VDPEIAGIPQLLVRRAIRVLTGWFSILTTSAWFRLHARRRGKKCLALAQAAYCFTYFIAPNLAAVGVRRTTHPIATSQFQFTHGISLLKNKKPGSFQRFVGCSKGLAHHG
jgi:hypothetical protein